MRVKMDKEEKNERCWICGRTREEIARIRIKGTSIIDHKNTGVFVQEEGFPPICLMCAKWILRIAKHYSDCERKEMKETGLLALFSLDKKENG
jgi:hypothetical protein